MTIIQILKVLQYVMWNVRSCSLGMGCEMSRAWLCVCVLSLESVFFHSLFIRNRSVMFPHFFINTWRPFASPNLRFPTSVTVFSSPCRFGAGAAEPGENRQAGAREGALAPGGPAGEGAAGEGEPAHSWPGNAAGSGSGGKSELPDSRRRAAHTEPRGSWDGAESHRERDDSLHQPGTVTVQAAVCFSLAGKVFFFFFFARGSMSD